jgi:RNA polymerase sigma-70 factor (ECF subfamily)
MSNLTETKRETVPPEQWVDSYGDYLYRYALLRLKDDASAQDAVQETFLAGIKGLDRFDGRVDVKYWLRGILRNKIVDHIRKSVREHPVDDREGMDIVDQFSFKTFGIGPRKPKPWQFDPHQEYEKSEFWEVFQQCLSRLKGNIQQVFVLKMLEGMPTDEVCKVLEIEPNHLWVLNHRARKQLKSCLEVHWDREEAPDHVDV